MMRGKTVMVTGANGGMGRVIARELARQEATVVMVARNPARGRRPGARSSRRPGAPPSIC